MPLSSCTLQIHEKLAIAHQLSVLGVDVCEAGFPVASLGDFEAVSAIAKEVGPRSHGREAPMVIAGLARAMQKDIDRCFEAVRHAPRHRIHTFLATSDLHVSARVRVYVCVSRRVAGWHVRVIWYPELWRLVAASGGVE